MRDFRHSCVLLAAVLCGGLTPLARAAQCTLTTASPLPSGTTGVAYSANVATTGAAVTSWSATGLPAGLTIANVPGNATTISGTPSVSGFFANVVVTGTGCVPKTFSLTISSTTTLTSSLTSPSTFGKSLSLTATVAPASATGKVFFYNNGNQIGGGTLAGGQTTLTTRVLPAGSNKIKAVYIGDGTNTSSTSNTVTQNVGTVAQSGFRSPVSYTNSALAGNPSGVALGDFNEDGKVDVAVADFTNNVSIFPGNGNGTFGSPTVVNAGSQPIAVAVGDFNGDGHLDLAVANFGVNSNSVSVLLGTGTGTFANAVNYATTVTGGVTRPDSIAVGDLNGDGIPDIVVANYSTSNVAILTGVGDGTFTALTASNLFSVGTNPAGIVLADFNGDGLTDIATANNGSANVTVLLNQGSLSFSTATYAAPGTGPTSLTTADFEGNGFPDIVLVDSDGSTHLYHNSGSGTFPNGATGATVGSSPNFITFGDFNGDGRLDVVTVDSGSNGLTVFLGNGAGNFGGKTGYSEVSGDQNPQTVAVGDFNGDGIPDLFVTNYATNDADVFLGLPATATSLNIAPNPVQFTATTTMTATVSSSDVTVPTGTVTFFDNGTQILSPATVNSSGVATLNNVASGGVGTHPITATYSGDAAHAGNTTAAFNLVVNKDTTTTTVSSNQNPAAPGQSITFTANVTESAGIYQPTGTVQFQDNGNNLGAPVTLSGSVATFTTSYAATGAHSITAVYSGDANANISTTPPLTENIQNATTTTLTSSANPFASGQSVTFTATVTPATATGTVAFKDNGATIGTGTLSPNNPGVVTFATATLSVGSHPITASYGGDAIDQPSTSAILSQVIKNATTTTLAVTPAGNPTFGSAVTLKATVLPNTATGLVEFFDGSNLLGVSSLSSGLASLTTPFVIAGSRTLSARYAGDANDFSSAGTQAETIIAKPIGGYSAPATYTAGNGPAMIAQADFNGDGIPDLAVVDSADTSGQSTVEIFLGNNNGTFQAPARITFGAGQNLDWIAAGDFNGDGKPDLAVAGRNPGKLFVVLNNGSGGFGAPVSYTGPAALQQTAVAISDFNGDGFADIAVSGDGGSVDIYLGVGTGAFTGPVGYTAGGNPYDVTAADFNGDGKVDLAFANFGSDNISVMLGLGDGTFGSATAYPVTSGSGPYYLATADLNGDGKLDIAVANEAGTGSGVSILLGNGDGTFGASTTVQSWIQKPSAIAFSDFNGDGKVDLVVTSFIGTANPVNLLLGDGTGAFPTVTTFPDVAWPLGVVVGDYNGDGRPDIAVANSNSAANNVSVLLSQSPTTTTLNSSANPSAYGTQVTLTASITPATANGTITFRDGGVTLGGGPVAVAGGSASLNIATLAVGSHSITAYYSGDPRNAPSSSQPSTVLGFTGSVPGTAVIDSSGLGTGFTTRLPGTGTSVTGTDPNLTVNASLGTLTINSTDSDLHLQFNLGPADLLGVPLSTLGVTANQDFSISATFRNIQYSQTFDQLGIFVGTSSSNLFRGGVLTSAQGFSAQTIGGSDTNSTTSATAPPAGDDMIVTMSRTGGVWSLSLQDLTNAANSTVVPINQPSYLNGVSGLVAGIFALNARNTTSKTETVSAFEAAVPNQVVNQVSTRTTLTAAPSPATQGATVTLTATVAPTSGSAIPTGTVTFQDGGVSISPSVVLNSSGIATFTTSTLNQGTHTLTAVYSGDANDVTSTSLPVTENILAATTTVLTSSRNPAVQNQPVTLSAQVSPAGATGTVTFKDAGTALAAPATVDSNGNATLQVSFGGIGGHALTAVYSGDANNATSTGNLSLSVIPSTTTSLTATPATVYFGQTMALTASVVPAGATGKVTFFDGATMLGTATLTGGTATLSTPMAGPGPGKLRAIYQGSAAFASSASAQLATTISVRPEAGFGAVTNYATGPATVTTVVGDFNLDGKQDLAVLDFNFSASPQNGIVSVLLGNGDGTFRAAPVPHINAGLSANDLAVGDFNGDGKPDLLMADGFNGFVLLTGNGDGTFTVGAEQVLQASGVFSLAVSDYNNDGIADFAFGGQGGVYYSQGNGDGTFQDGVRLTTEEDTPVVQAADMNSDGNPDIVKLGANQLSIILGNGDGTFQSANTYSPGNSLVTFAVGDFTGDAKPDVAINNENNGSIFFLPGNGDGTLGAAVTINVGTSSGTLAAGDFNGDGNLDILVADVVDGNLYVVPSLGNGSFGAPIPTSLGSALSTNSSSVLGVGDFNGGTGRSDVSFLLSTTGIGVISGQPPSVLLRCPIGSTPALVSIAYSLTCTAAGGAAPYTYSVTSGTLPLGLSLNAATGVISGTPQTAQSTSFTIQVTDSGVPAQGQTAGVSLTVATPFNFANPTLPAANANAPYRANLVVGGTPPYACSISAGSLPSGLTLDSPTCTLNGTPTPAGTYPFTVNIADSGTPPQTATKSFSLPVQQAGTTTGLTAAPNPSFVGAQVTLTASVTPPTATGNVTFKDGAATLATVAAGANGQAQFQISTLSVGPHSLTAVYNGDVNNAGSTSPVLTQTVNQDTVLTTLNTAPNPSLVGQNVALTAVVHAAVTGTVTFKDGSTAISGAITLTNGTASFNISTLAVGNHSITANYSGDVNDAPSVSAAVTQEVRVATSVTLSEAPTSSVFGQPVILTASVAGSSPTPTGKVTFFDGTTILGIGTIAGNTASLSTPLLASGTRSLGAFYQGDNTYATARSSSAPFTVSNFAQNGFGPVNHYTTGPNSDAIAIGDFNGDGIEDIASSTFNGTLNQIAIQFGAGNGTLAAAPTYYNSVTPVIAIAVADVNNDGLPDLILATPAATGISVMLNTGGGIFGSPTVYFNGGSTGTVAIADYNGDGIPDVVAGLSGGIMLMTGDGTGAFVAGDALTQVTSGSNVYVAAADLNGDGKADIVAIDNTGTVYVLLGNGDGTFQTATTYSLSVTPLSITTADFNGDGHADVLIGDSSTGVQVMLGSATGALGAAVNYPAGAVPVAVASGDFNGDGKLDIAASDFSSPAISILAGNGDGTFQAAVNYPITAPAFAIAAGNFRRGGGRTDLAAAGGSNGNVDVLLSQIPQLSLGCAGPTPVLTGNPYTITCPASGGVPPYTYSISAGALPNGLTLNTNTGTISGTPTTPGNFSFTVKAVDGDTPAQNATASVSVTVVTPLTMSATPLPSGTVNSSYTTTLASGGTPPYTCAVGSGALPSGVTLAAATCVLSGTPTAPGIFGFKVIATDSGAPPQANSQTFSLTIQQITTTTGLTSSVNPSAFNASTLLTATVTPSTATGTVTFKDGSTVLGGGPIALNASGVATLIVSTLSPGSHSLVAVYSGDINDAGSGSSVLTQVVENHSSVVLTSSANPSTQGQNLTFTATITPASASGTVNFTDGGNSIGTGTIASGVATLTTNSLAAGVHTIVGTYGGDALDFGSTSNSLSQTIKSTTTTTLSATPSSSVLSGAVTITATISPASTGQVTFYDGGNVLGIRPVVAGAASLFTKLLPSGAHKLSAFYAGSATSLASTGALSFIVTSLPENGFRLPAAIYQSSDLLAIQTIVADFNNDGIADLAVANGANIPASVSILLGNGDGTFGNATGFTVAAQAHGLADGDFNGDGKTDLAVTDNGSGQVSILLGNGDGTFQTHVEYSTGGTNPSGIAVADVDGDGIADLVIANFGSGNIAILYGTATGTFGTPNLLPVGASPNGVVAADFNGDGVTDLAVVNEGGDTVTFIPGVNGTLFGAATPFSTNGAGNGHQPFSIAAGDVNGDGKLDIVTANSASDTVSVLIGNGLGGFAQAALYSTGTGTGPDFVAIGDFNGDGFPDIVTANSNTQDVSVLPNSGTGTFGGAVRYGTNVAAPAKGFSVAVSDFNSDGRSDLVVSNFNANNVSVLLGLAPTTTVLSSSANPTSFGGSTIFTAAVSPSTATGTVTFFSDGTQIGNPVTVASGSAALTFGALAVGTHSITATYNGDNNDATSTSLALSQTVNKAVSGTSVSSSLNPSTFGASVTFTASVTAGATGTVNFLDGGNSIGTGTLNNGTATLAISNLAVGPHTITASYGGDGNFLGSTSGIFSQVVNKAATTTTLTGAPNPGTFGQNLTLTATVTPASASGTVTFLDGATVLGTGTLGGGVATFTLSTLSTGAHSLTATYVGDGNDLVSTSSPLPLTVNKAPSATGLTSSLNPSNFGQSVTFTATVTPSTATGTVAFLDGATTLGTGTISAGAATLAVTTLAGGPHSVTASYGGDGNYNGSVSVALTQTVNPLSTSTTLTISPNPSTLGQTVTLTATISQPAATGSVTFKDGSTSLGTANVSGGVATLAVSTLSAGPHSLTANYGGDGNYAASSSQPVNQTVRTPATLTLNTSVSGTARLGAPVTLTASVTPNTATGNVVFFDGVGILGTATLASGQASITTRLLPSGNRTLTALYQGSASFGPAAANVLQPVRSVLQNGFAADVSYTINANTPATAVADFNGDGLPDLVVAAYDGNGNGSVNILLNNGNGAFQNPVAYPAGSSPVAIATADLNGDGVPDIVTADSGTGSLNVLLSSATGVPGTVTAIPAGAAPKSVVVADFNGDGFPDLASGNSDGSITVVPGIGGGLFGPPHSYFSTGLAATLVAADFNNDGRTDLGVTDSNNFRVLLGNGDGTFSLFTTVAVSGAQSAAVGDLNNDGITDVVVAEANAVVVLRGQGDGSFATPSSYPAGTDSVSAVIGDFNGDGNQDFAAGDIATGSLNVFYGNGLGGVLGTASFHGLVVGLSVADFNGDGRTDVASGDGTSQGAGVFLGAPAVPVLACPPQTLPAILGSAYSLNCGASGGLAPYTFTISSGSLPPGLSLNAATGSIGGTPNTFGNYTFTLLASDSQAPPQTASLNLGILATSQLALASSIPAGNTGIAYLIPPLAVGGNLPYNCIVSAGALPTGLSLNASTCQLSGTPSALGTFNFTVTASDSGAPVQNASQAYSVAVTKAPTTTSLGATQNPITFGQTVTLGITMTPATATGSITIQDNGNAVAVTSLTNGAAQVQLTGVTVGSHPYTAIYGGDASNLGSTSAIVTVVVNKITAVVTLSSSLNPSRFGGSITLTAPVSPSDATGTVTFKDNGNVLSTVSLDGNGVATLAESALSVGSHNLTATYNGDATHAVSPDAPLTQSVLPANTSTTLTSSLNPSQFGQSVILTAAVTPTTATGTVTFSDGANVLGTGNLNANGVATFSASTLSVGAHSLTATYAGDTNDATSTSSAVAQNVGVGATTTILSSSLNPSLPGQQVTFTATISPAAATGTVTFNDGGNALAPPVALSGGQATFTISTLNAGAHTITASYSGDSNYAASVSSLIRNQLNFHGNAAGTIADSSGLGTGFTTRLPGTGGSFTGNDPNLTLNTGTGTLGLTTTAADPNGQVNIGSAEFLGMPLSSVGVTNNEDFAVIATFNNIQYSQSGDQLGVFVGSSSTTAFRGGGLVIAPTPNAFTAQTVNGSDTNVQTVPAQAPVAGDNILLTLSRTNGVWALLVQDLTNPANSGSIPLAQPAYLNGVSGLIAGVFAASPGGTPKNETVSSFALAAPVQTVGTFPSTTVLTSSANPAIVGAPITLMATLSPAAATGTVTFQDGTTTIGTGNLNNGAATLNISTLAFGTHALTAVYPGDAITGPSTSAVLNQTVNFTPLSITTTSLPAGAAGNVYSPVTLHASGGSGNFTWSATGLPAGMSLTAAGVLSGSSAAAFSGTVTVTVTDNVSTLHASQAFTLTISAPAPPPPPVNTPPLTINGPSDLGSVVPGGTLSGAFSASGGTPPYTFAIASGDPSFSVDANGHLTGSPAAVGNASVAVQVIDSKGVGAQASATYSVFGFITGSLSGGQVGVNYSASVTVAGGSGPYTLFATGVPPGLSFSAGTLSGKPTAAGSYSMTVQANDAKGLSATRSFPIAIAAAPPPPPNPTPLQITTTALTAGAAGQAYSQTLGASGGTPGYTWAQTGGALPPGVSLDPSGNVAGLPSAPGSYSFGVQVTDTAGGKVLGTVSLTIQPAPLQILTGSTLPAGMLNVDYPAQTLTASGGVAPYTFSVTGSLPAGLTLTNGQISGTPAAQGDSGFTLKVTDSATPANTASQVTTILIRANSADLLLSSGSLSFSMVSGSTAVPDPATVTVSSTDVSQILNYTIGGGSATWVSASGSTSTPGSISVGLTSAALALNSAGSPYSTNVVLTCTSGTCNGKTQSIAVTLTVTDAPPELSVDSTLFSFVSTTSNPQSSSASLGIKNAGGGILKINGVVAADPWISVGSFPATIPAGPGATITITANPGSLGAGFYLSAVNVLTSAGNASIPVSLLITADSSMSLGPAGAQFSMPQGGALGNPNGSFLVSVNKATPVNFSATVLPGAPWLHAGTGGRASNSSPGSLSYSIDSTISTLPAGPQYGTIRVTADGIVNSPLDYQVVVNISPASTPVTPDPEPAGLLFLSSKAGPQAPQLIQVYASSTAPLTYQASTNTADGGGWLSIDSETGSALAGKPGSVQVLVNSTGLKAGVYRGTVNFASGSSVRSVNITLVVEPPLAASTSSTVPVTRVKPADAGPICAGATLVATQTGLVSNFSAPAAWPTPLAIKLVDSCGTIIGNGQIVATFSNGDPPLALTPVDPVNGLYSGTWTPRQTAAQITISAHATVAGYPAASVQIAGKVTPNQAPQLAPNGTFDVFHPQVGAGLGPGNIVQIYGSGLAGQTASPQVLPLPTEVQGTQVLIGGVASPLYYVSPGQVNAQIPFELEAGKQYQVIVSANGALTTPQPIQLNAGAPAVLQFTSGLIVAQHQDGSLVSDTAPAAPGEFIVLYMSGLGATDIPVPSGQPSPANPPARVLDTPILTMNGTPQPILFAGLTPTLVGLYQINLQIPQGLADGSYDIVVAQSGVVSNTTSLPVKK